MLPARLRLRTDRGVEAPLEEAEYEDEEDRSNLLRMSLCAPELETRRTTGLRPGVVLRSGIAATAKAAAGEPPVGESDRSAEGRTRTEPKCAPQILAVVTPPLPLPPTPLYLLAACPPLPPPPLPLHPSPPLSHPHTFFP